MKYHIFARNPITRAGVIRKLMALGYPLVGNFTVSAYHKTYPAKVFPFVTIELDRGQYVINVVSNYVTLNGRRVEPAHIQRDIPTIAQLQAEMDSVCKPIFIPPAAKYSMQYRKQSGAVETYTISNPIEADNEKMTCYAFGHGIRSFKLNGIRSFTKVA